MNSNDKNIKIITECKEKIIKNKKYKIIEGILSYIPNSCPCCGAINTSSDDIIKWGYKRNCIVKIPKLSNCLTRLILHKQRFFCKHCNNTFTAETSLVNRNKNISNNTNLQVRLELMDKQSEKDIAKKMDVSVSTVDRILNSIASHTILRHPTLPTSMNCGEFKAILFNQNKNLSLKMKKALKLYKENIKYIENSFKYDINNSVIEGTNNLIKCVKRIAFGYKKYEHFIVRIFLIKGIIKG